MRCVRVALYREELPRCLTVHGYVNRTVTACEHCNFITQAYISGGGTDNLFILLPLDIIFKVQSWLLYLQTKHTKYVPSLSKSFVIIIIIIIIIIFILVIIFMQSTYNYVPETNHVSRVYSDAEVLYLQFVLLVLLLLLLLLVLSSLSRAAAALQ